MNKEIKIFLADDHILLRDALAKLINDFPDYRVIGLASHGKEIMEQVSSSNIPDILVLDLNMPVMDGFDVAKIFHKQYPKVKVVALTMYDSEIALIRLLHVGVKGFIKKDIHPNELHSALDAIAAGGFYYAHSTTGKLATLFIRNNNHTHNLEKGMLSEMEIQFLRYACTDMTYKEIATALKMTPRTIDNYRDHLFDKLGVHSRVGLAIYALKNALICF